MKKKLFFIVCFWVALTTSSVMANNCLDNVSASKITYTVNLGDISGMNEVEINNLIDNALANIDKMHANELQCEVAVEMYAGITKVTGKVSGDCSEVAVTAKKLANDLVEAFSDIK